MTRAVPIYPCFPSCSSGEGEGCRGTGTGRAECLPVVHESHTFVAGDTCLYRTECPASRLSAAVRYAHCCRLHQGTMLNKAGHVNTDALTIRRFEERRSCRICPLPSGAPRRLGGDDSSHIKCWKALEVKFGAGITPSEVYVYLAR